MQVNDPRSITHDELIELAEQAKGSIKALYLHWTAGRYQQFFDDYHLNIDEDGKVYQTCNYLAERKSHTYKRNTGAVGIAICCCLDASWRGTYPNFGSVPPTAAQLRSLAWVIAILCIALGLEITGETVMTHGEAAYRDGYGPGSGDPDTRWDLFWLPDALDGRFRQGGVYLRDEARKCYAHLLTSCRSDKAEAAPTLMLPLFAS